MIIFQDLITGDEVFSDSYDHKDSDDGFFIEAEGSWVTLGEVDVDIGANPSAEGGGDDEGVSGDAQKVVDIQNAFRLQETGYDKKGFTAYLKTWVKKIDSILAERGETDKQAQFKEKAPAALKYLISKTKELQFFTGESLDPEGSMAYAYYPDGASTPVFLFPRLALKEVKV